MTVTAVHALADLSDEAAALIRPDREPRDYVEFLIRNDLYADAVGLLAHVLPKREAVWWAWTCAREVAEDAEAEAAVLDATGKWIVEQTDELRRAAGEAAEALDYATPSAMAGLAAFMCGDTLGPADAAPAPPPETAAAQLIGGAICMAAALGDPEGIDGRFGQFIARGMERADKGKIWAPEPDTAAGGEGE
jgi:hypothetical protein